MSIEWYGNIEQDGSTSEEYRPATELIKKYQLQNTVFLHDKTDRIHSIMAKADYVALFSYVEGLPNAILEGMMLSKPIILTRMSDYAVLVDHSNGFLCNADDVQSIKDALMSAIDTSIDERVRMGECSYQKVIMNCSQDSVISSWKKVITDIGVGDKKCT